jgi:hypothetical protein
MTETETEPTTRGSLIEVIDVAALPEGHPLAMPPAKKKSAAKVPAKKPPGKPRAVAAVPALEPEMMNDLLLAIHELAAEIDISRSHTDDLIAKSDLLIREAVDEGERYRDIASAAGRTVPWVQMSLRRVAGVSTHPAKPIPDTRIRKARRRAS